MLELSLLWRTRLCQVTVHMNVVVRWILHSGKTMYGKKYIFDCRIKDNIVSIDRFKSKLKNRLEVEFYIIHSWSIRLNTKKILLIELYNSLCS